MAAPQWQPGTLYPTGSIVQPLSAVTPAGAPIVNPQITGSATGWTLPAQFAYDAAVTFQAGSGAIRFNTVGNGTFAFQATAGVAVTPGVSITGSVMFQQGASSAGNLGGQVMLQFTGPGDVAIPGGTFLGNLINSASGGAWLQSSVTAIAPVGAAFVRIGAVATRVGQNLAAWFDNFSWNYVSQPAQAGLVFKAVQPATGSSGGSEPAWPSTVGVQVVDNTVIWEAIAATRVTWQAKPIMQSGATEPTWPTTLGGEVVDGTMKWVAIERRVTDVNCPQSKVVTIGQSKIYAGDGDIVRYSATVNPLDWTTANNAGYLPTGLQAVGAINLKVLNQYRSNLVAFTPSTFQNWQIDPDPANMAYLDGIEGIGSSFHRAAQPVANDLFYLSPLGVRSVGISGGSTNLAAGDVGMPIDPIVQEAVRVANLNGSRVRSTYWPASGQYWLSFADYPPPPVSIVGDFTNELFVGNTGTYQYHGAGGVGALTWSISAGALPPGASLNATTGLVTYTLTNRGTFNWTIRATDVDGNFADLPDGTVVYQLVWTYDWTRVNTNVLGGVSYSPITHGPGAPRVGYTNLATPSWSDDLTTWVAGTPASGVNVNPSAWSPTLGYAVRVRTGTTNAAHTSSDMKTWSPIAYSGTTNGASCGVWDPVRNVFFFIGGTAAAWRKYDGTTWTSGVYGAGLGPDDAMDIAVDPVSGRYVAVSGAVQTQNKRLAWSDDGGVTWSFATATGNIATNWVSVNFLKNGTFGAVGDTGSAAGRKAVTGPGDDTYVDITPSGLTQNLASMAHIPELDIAVLIPNTTSSSGATLGTFWTSSYPLATANWVARANLFPGGNHHQMRWVGAPFYKLAVVSTGGTAGNGITISNITKTSVP